MEPSDEPRDLQTVTSSSLLEGLRDPANQTRWQHYVDRYRPLIVSLACRRGLSAVDAEDFAQTVLLEFSKAYGEGRYDREKGRLRSWLFGIVHRQLANHHRTMGRGLRAAGMDGGLAEQLGAEGELERMWHEEWEKAVLKQCLDEIRGQLQPKTFEAFEEFALRERPAAEVARELGLSENAVFGAKRRVLRRLREIRPVMEGIW